MDWRELGAEIAKIGLPLLGAALPLPGGAELGAAIAAHIGEPTGKPENILAALASDANKIMSARQFELQHQESMLKIITDAEIEKRKADSADIAAVNATMTQEAASSASESWYQKGWRPFNGFVVGAASGVSALFVCYLCYLGVIGHDPAALNAIPSVAFAMATILAIPGAAVGIAAWHRGVAQVEQVRQSGG